MSDRDDDYLWDRSGKADPDVASLEKRLAPLRYRTRSFEAATPGRARRRAWWPRLAIAAGFLLVLSGRETSLEVKALEGAPRIDGWRMKGDTLLNEGMTLETDDASRASISLQKVRGNIEVAKNSRIRVVEVGDRRQMLDLAQGEISAKVFAPPRLFLVDTPSATAVDLGCVYKLTVDDKGNSLLQVDFGWVSLEHKDGKTTSDTPGGAECRSRVGLGPGTPYFVSASPRFIDALTKYDFEGESEEHLRVVLEETGRRDSLTLWHLLKTVKDPAWRHRIYERWASYVPPPSGVNESNALEPANLDSWKDITHDTWYAH